MRLRHLEDYLGVEYVERVSVWVPFHGRRTVRPPYYRGGRLECLEKGEHLFVRETCARCGVPHPPDEQEKHD